MAERILVVDDEREIADLVALYLTNEGYSVTQCATVAQALAALREQPPELAILDIMLPDGSGLDLCRKIRETHRWPILMLTARGQEVDKITGLTLGADDYVTKGNTAQSHPKITSISKRRKTPVSPDISFAKENPIRPPGRACQPGSSSPMRTAYCILRSAFADLGIASFGIAVVLSQHRIHVRPSP